MARLAEVEVIVSQALGRMRARAMARGWTSWLEVCAIAALVANGYCAV
jgi:CHASE2 domain-containing sensor protein